MCVCTGYVCCIHKLTTVPTDSTCFSTLLGTSTSTLSAQEESASRIQSLTRLNSTWSFGLRRRSSESQKSRSTSPEIEEKGSKRLGRVSGAGLLCPWQPRHISRASGEHFFKLEARTWGSPRPCASNRFARHEPPSARVQALGCAAHE